MEKGINAAVPTTNGAPYTKFPVLISESSEGRSAGRKLRRRSVWEARSLTYPPQVLLM